MNARHSIFRTGRTIAPILAVAALLSLCLSCATILSEAARHHERGKAGLTEHRVALPDGHTVVYLTAGVGEPLLLLHGFGGDKDNWTRLAAHLTDTFRVVAPDLPGFGESSRIEEQGYSIQNQTERLAAFTDALGLDSFHLAGNSMGGWIAGWYAVHHPGRVLSLTLICAAGVNAPEQSDLQRMLEKGYNPLLVEDVDDYDRLMDFVFVNPPFIPKPLKARFAAQAVENRRFNEKIWNDIHSDLLDLEPFLGQIAAPTLVIWGDSDRVLHPSSVPVFTQGIAGSRSRILEQCGHLPMVELPEKTARIMTGFITGN